ncbi:hypothetical protein QTN25_006345 [Entamoeba marina]
MTLYPQYALKRLKIGIKNKISEYFVWCQVDSCVIAKKFIKQSALTGATGERAYRLAASQNVLAHEATTVYQACFIKVGDQASVYCCHDNNSRIDQWSLSTSH